MRILFFGDSLTQGTIGVSYVDKLARALPQHRLINKGINGDTSLNLYRRVQDDVIALRPDLVFVMVGINDALSTIEASSRLYYRYTKRVPGGRVSPLAYRENLRAVLSKLAAANIRTCVVLQPLEYRPESVDCLKEINAHAAQLCRELDIPALDAMAVFAPSDIPPRPPFGRGVYIRNLQVMLGWRRYDQWQHEGRFTYSFDGVHLTEDGARRMADLIMQFLKREGLA
jgi:lysophospholipase L1-like esterase